MKKRRISGIKPTGEQPHLGNYLGMMRPALAESELYENMLFIPDYHALTSLHNPKAMEANSFELALDFLSLGMDPSDTILFRQSDVPEVTELTWIFNCLTPMGLLERAHAYKDAQAKGRHLNVGVFDYPVLMAADILIYGAHLVPVGKDQKQHVEIARDIAEKFNHTFGEVFVLPEAVIQEDVETVIGLDGEKMSKSYGNTIMLFEEEKSLEKKVLSYKTDPARIRKDDPGHPEDCAAYAFHHHFSKENLTTIAQECRAGSRGCVDCKRELFANVRDHLAPFREKRAELLRHPDYIEEVLTQGGKRARALAQEYMEKVYSKTGLRKK